jgi:hypothetical protein
MYLKEIVEAGLEVAFVAEEVAALNPETDHLVLRC